MARRSGSRAVQAARRAPRGTSAVAACVARGAEPPLRGFPPVLNRRVTTLILGSFPGAASLAARQYYAHPRNQFWRIVGAALGTPLADLPYRARLRALLAHRIGLWDVIDACERDGSLDQAIRNARPNRFDRLHRRAPALRRVLFNGLTAARFARAFAAAGYEVAVLPSTSPAHASRTFEQKLAVWRRALRPAPVTRRSVATVV